MASLDLKGEVSCSVFPSPGMMCHASMRAEAMRDFHLIVYGRIFATVQVCLNVMAILA